MSATNPPTPNVNTFNNDYWNTQDQFLNYPVAQGAMSFKDLVVNGVATFNLTPQITATDPSSNDSSNKVPTTRWVQDAFSAGGGMSNNVYNFPTSWKSSLIREDFTGSSPPTWTAQSVDLIFPYSSSLGTGTNAEFGFSVNVCLETTISGVSGATGTTFGALLAGTSIVTISLNLRTDPAGVIITKINSTPDLFTNQTINYGTAGGSLSVSRTPISTSLVDRNKVRITFANMTDIAGNATATTANQAKVYAIYRSINILGSNLNGYTNTANFNTFNSATLPNSNSNGTTLRNLGAYLSPVSNNTY